MEYFWIDVPQESEGRKEMAAIIIQGFGKPLVWPVRLEKVWRSGKYPPVGPVRSESDKVFHALAQQKECRIIERHPMPDCGDGNAILANVIQSRQ